MANYLTEENKKRGLLSNVLLSTENMAREMVDPATVEKNILPDILLGLGFAAAASNPATAPLALVLGHLGKARLASRMITGQEERQEKRDRGKEERDFARDLVKMREQGSINRGLQEAGFGRDFALAGMQQQAGREARQEEFGRDFAIEGMRGRNRLAETMLQMQLKSSLEKPDTLFNMPVKDLLELRQKFGLDLQNKANLANDPGFVEKMNALDTAVYFKLGVPMDIAIKASGPTAKLNSAQRQSFLNAVMTFAAQKESGQISEEDFKSLVRRTMEIVQKEMGQ